MFSSRKLDLESASSCRSRLGCSVCPACISQAEPLIGQGNVLLNSDGAYVRTKAVSFALGVLLIDEVSWLKTVIPLLLLRM